MKHNFLRGAALALVAAFSIGTAQAASIDGVLNFGGQAEPLPGPGIGDATGLSFTSGFFVAAASGDFAGAGIGFGDTGSLADFMFNPLVMPVDPFLTVGSFSYVLETVTIVDQDAMFLVLSGTGTLSGPGDDTAYDFSMSVDGVGGNMFAFSGTISPAIVPVPGALILMMSGLAALGIRRRS